MRRDMKRVIITPPRHHGYGDGRQGRIANRDMEDLPTKESMRKPHLAYGSGKSFSDFLAPLHRFLEKNTNRPWNDVYSEICEHADARSVDGWHLRQHVGFEVYQHVKVGDGGRIYHMRYSYWNREMVELWYGALYVCPETGLLKKYTRKSGHRWWKEKFSCLEARIAHYTPDVKYHSYPTKYCTLEYSNGELWAVFWKENDKLVARQRATSDHAYKMIDGVRNIIRSNLKSALISHNSCIKKMASIIKKEEDKKTYELEKKAKKLDNALAVDSKRKKDEKRAKKHLKMAV